MRNSQQAAYDEEASTDELSSEGECLNLNQLDDQDEISECNTYNMSDWMIPQLDGLDDEALNINEIFTIKCESIELIQMMNFLRSFDLLWELNDAHNLCSFKENCFFCHMRSSFLRLTEERTMGPKGKKLNEIVSQLGQYEQKLYIHWRSLLTNVPLLVENTMKLLESDAFNPNPYFGIPSGQCQQCRFAFKDENKIFYDISSVSMVKIKEVSMEHIIKLLIRKISRKECCSTNFKTESSNRKMIIVRFSFPVNLKISQSVKLGDGTVSYISHLEEKEENQYSAFFRVQDEVFQQNSDTEICKSRYGNQRNVILLALQFSLNEPTNISLNKEQFVYEKKVQLSLHRKYLSVMSPDKHNEKAAKQREYEINRNKNEIRQNYRRQSDKKRDQTDERKQRAGRIKEADAFRDR